MKIVKILTVVICGILSASASAFTIDTETIKNKSVFGIEFSDGTSFYGLASTVSSVSKQEFIVGPMLVTEVNITFASMNNTQLRIYNSTPVPASAINDIAKGKLPDNLKPYAEVPKSVEKQINRAQNVSDTALSQPKVFKDYPLTTHAHTIEFVVKDLENLELFYNRICADFTMTIKGEKETKATPSPDIKTGFGGKLYILEETVSDVSDAIKMDTTKRKNEKKK